MTLLEVRDVSRRFGGLLALSDVSFDVEECAIMSVIGPNGAGKTTLFNIISGILPPNTGTIRLRDTRITGMPSHRIAERGLARTFQNLCLFDHMTVLENVMVGRHARKRCGFLASMLHATSERKEEAAIHQEALHQIDRVGLAEMADVPVHALSFGQRRMVELARALATDPGILLLDEPASGLNTREKSDLESTIRKIRDSGVTILLVEHDMSLVMDISDMVLVLHYGKPIAEGTPARVRADPQVIAVYLGGDEPHA